MCGIVGYIGKQKALPILLDGLKSLEYRGYDSAGVAVIEAGDVPRVMYAKSSGRIAALEEKIYGKKEQFNGTLGIAHTRWATHGEPNEANAHPHNDCAGNIFIVHNGIIENYKKLKEKLLATGHTFLSDTDSEVIAHLIEHEQSLDQSYSLEEAVRRTLCHVRGTYGLAVVDIREPEKLVVARNFSPLILGVGENEYILGSDVSAVSKHTRNVVYMNDGEIAVVTPRGHHIFNIDNATIVREPETIDWTIEEAQKNEHPYFMGKEIFEQPEALTNSMRGRLISEEGLVKLGGIELVTDKLREAERIIFVGCGTAYNAALVGEYMIEEYAEMPVEVEFGAEFRYRKPVFRDGDALIALSQSGETADTIAAVREAKQKGVLTLGIVNMVGSTIARETDAGVYQHVGPEIGVASTKAFTSQIAILGLLAVFFGRQRNMSKTMGKRITEELSRVPKHIARILEQSALIQELAKKYASFNNFFYLGRKYNYPVALEGALKIKEISYVHAEGYAAGEMKHGSIALIDEEFPSVCIVPSDSVYEKMVSNIEEIKARRGPVIAIATEGNKDIAAIADDVIYIPKTLEMLTPLLSVVPLQLLAYYVGLKRGVDVDKPRNLAKSVTVE